MTIAIVSREAMKSALYSTLNSTGPYKLHLFTNNFVLDRDTLITSLTEASYDTYPPGGITVLPTPTLSDGNEEKTTTMVANFPAPTASGPIDVYGWWVDGSTGFFDPNTYIVGANFPSAPITLTNGGSSLPIVLDVFALDYNDP